MIIYLILASIGLIGFWFYYYLVLRKTTFFNLNRWYLLSAIIFCLLYPFSYHFIKVERVTIEQEQNSTPTVAAELLNSMYDIKDNLQTFNDSSTHQILWLPIIYFSVCGLLLFRLGWSIVWVRRLTIGARSVTGKGFKIFHCDKIKQPMSLFKSIYFPKSWNDELPQEILLHELEHVKKWHFIDLLIIELVAVVFWFNPVIYLYKKSIRLNLEYLADKSVLDQKTDILHYQSMLLSYTLKENHSSALVTNFSTPLKNRIEMMKKRKSSTWMRLTMIGALPLATLLVAMNTKSELKAPIAKAIKPLTEFTQSDDKPTQSPLGSDKLLKVTSGFGQRTHPISKVKKLHTGIDLAAETGTPIYATADGKIVLAQNDTNHGNYVLIQHSDVYETQYSHMNYYIVLVGEVVKKGQLIGYVGSTGQSMAPHLHYEIHENGEPVDPQNFLGC
jgi:murein DD-endopeptidase MepM/ murein hydrolase activator NlpD